MTNFRHILLPASFPCQPCTMCVPSINPDFSIANKHALPTSTQLTSAPIPARAPSSGRYTMCEKNEKENVEHSTAQHQEVKSNSGIVPHPPHHTYLHYISLPTSTSICTHATKSPFPRSVTTRCRDGSCERGHAH